MGLFSLASHRNHWKNLGTWKRNFKLHRLQETVWLAEDMLVSQELCRMHLGIYLLDRHRVSQSVTQSVSRWLVGQFIDWLVHLVRRYFKKRECCVSLSQVHSASILFGFPLLIIILPLLHTHTHTHTHTLLISAISRHAAYQSYRPFLSLGLHLHSLIWMVSQ